MNQVILNQLTKLDTLYFNDLALFPSYCVSLNTLVMGGRFTGGNQAEIEFLALVARNPNLTSISLQASIPKTDQVLSILNERKLKLFKCFCMNTSDITSILKNFKNYTELIFHVKIVDITQGKSSVLESNKLTLYSCFQIDSGDICNLFMEHFTSSLTIIRLSFVRIVGLSIIPILFLKCENLKELVLDSCIFVNEKLTDLCKFLMACSCRVNVVIDGVRITNEK
jgi:hypothetical protein